MTKRIVLTILSATMLMAQSEIRPDLVGLVYPALPRAARIQGSVKFTVVSNEITLVSGHQLLIEAAKQNLEKWAGTVGGQCFTAIYSFSISNDFPPLDTTVVDEPIGNRFERLFLRLFHRPVTRKVKRYVDRPPLQRVSYRVMPAENGCPVVEIDVEAEAGFVETKSTVLASR